MENPFRRAFMFTYLQLDDPVWFLIQALKAWINARSEHKFMFTSRTGHSFLSVIARSFNTHMKGIASKLAVTRITARVDSLTVAISDAELCINVR